MLKVPRKMIAVDPIFESDKRGSIYVPEQAKSRVKQGIVKYIGAEVTTVGIGDYVFFSGYAGTVFRLENEGTLLFLTEDNIVATLKERQTDIAGLFFYGGDGKYFTATFEQAMMLITKAMNKYYATVKEQQDRAYEGKKSKTIQGRLLLIKNQEHMTGPSCWCKDLAFEYNQGVCPKCGSFMHRAYLTGWPDAIYHCENLESCNFNTIGV